MSEKDTIEVETSAKEKISDKKDKLDEKIETGQEKVNKAIEKGKDTLDEKIETGQEKVNEKIDSGKNITDRVASDFSKSVDGFFDGVRQVQEKVNNKVNDYRNSIVENLDINLAEDEENYYIQVATAGVAKENIEIEAGDYEISIVAEFPSFIDENEDNDAELIVYELKRGTCVKNINFLNQIDMNNITATYDNGLTNLVIPKIKAPKQKVTFE